METGHQRSFLSFSFNLSFVTLLSLSFIFASSSYASLLSNPPLLGIHPLDEKYFQSDVIKCKDGSKSFTRDRVNDDFCDCVDGTDEPGTSACPAGKFYCRNLGNCCDGSDENDGSISCPKTCIMGGNIDYKTGSYVSTVRDTGSIDAKETKNGANLEDLIEKLKGLKAIIILQVILVGGVVVYVCWIFNCRVRSKRRRYR